MSVPPAGVKQRHLFIDLYRAGVILLMLEGHTIRQFASGSIQQTFAFQLHEFIHGLTAPAFLFGAGLTFVISTRNRWVEYHRWAPPLARRVKRLSLVLLLGFALNLPYFSFRKIIIDGTIPEYLQLFKFDVLHCIGLGLLTLHALVFFFKKESRFYGLVLSTIVAVCFLTPLIWDIDFLQYLPLPLAQMLNGLHGSPFPIFPYVGFLFAGVIVSWEFLIAAEQNRTDQFVKRLSIIGAALIVIGIMFDLLPIRIYPTYNFWFTSPNYFLIRMGALMMATSAFYLVAQRIRKPRPIITVLGRESLFVYVLHLLVLYGSAMNPALNLKTTFGSTLGLLEVSIIFIALLSVMLIVATMWSYLKQNQFNVYRIIQLAASGMFLYYFFTRDF